MFLHWEYSTTVRSIYLTILIEANGTEANTPANDYWYLSFGYTIENGTNEQIIDIALAPDGFRRSQRTIQSDLSQANTLLQPLISFVKTQITVPFDIWKLLNALFVGYYWFVLADLGQASPTTYNNSGSYLVPSNFSQPIFYSATNNVIFNTTLSRSVFSEVGLNGSAVAATSFDAIVSSNLTVNPDSEGNPRIRRSYYCTVREVKQTLSLLVSVLGLGFSLVGTWCSIGLCFLRKFYGPAVKTREESSQNGKANMKLEGIRKTGDFRPNGVHPDQVCHVSVSYQDVTDKRPSGVNQKDDNVWYRKARNVSWNDFKCGIE